MADEVAGRTIPRLYGVARREPLHTMLTEAIGAAGGRVLVATPATTVPFYFGVAGPADDRFGLVVYPFTANQKVTANRPVDEHRFQIRYGAEETWREDHRLHHDVAQVDTTLVLGVHVARRVFVGVDPLLYDPLPMGISFEFKEADVAEAARTGWHVYERVTRAGQVRAARVLESDETVVIFKPDRLLDYVRLQREAVELGYDSPLRFVAAAHLPSRRAAPTPIVLHQLEQTLHLTSQEILNIIAERHRRGVALKGGAAEYKLEQSLRADPRWSEVVVLDKDAQPDFSVVPVGGDSFTIECKNCSPKRYENGDFRVEVQKTRPSAGDPAGRYYRVDQFDVVAACLFAPTKEWRFVFKATRRLTRHPDFPDRVAPMQRVDSTWTNDLIAAVTEARGH